MYCNNCGNQLNEGKNFCSSCGMRITPDKNQSTTSIINAAGGTGYSPRISDPLFSKYIKNSNRYAGIFALILAVGAIIGFYIAGENSSEMDNPESLYIGFGIGGMFLLIALFQIIGRKKGRDWDGTVVDKRVQKKREQHGTGDDDSYWTDYLQYVVFIRGDDGRKHKISVNNDDTRYNYYQIGDRIRFHSGLNSYEKQDKSKDTIIFCNACASLNDIGNDYCFRCKCPLLK